MLKNDVRIILCETSHPGNIGAAARAIKNMGLSQLVLVSPKKFPDPKADELASGAVDILANAKVVSTLAEAIADCQWVYGTSARDRALPWPVVTPKEMAENIAKSVDEKIAIVFGPEQSGLTNEDLQLCDYHLSIPANPIYSSLNLAQAVQVVTYEVYQAHIAKVPQDKGISPLKATNESVTQLMAQFEKVAIDLRLMNPASPRKILPKMQRLLVKAQLDQDEVNILRGFLKLVKDKL